jgi:hypothetical protein
VSLARHHRWDFENLILRAAHAKPGLARIETKYGHDLFEKEPIVAKSTSYDCDGRVGFRTKGFAISVETRKIPSNICVRFARSLAPSFSILM